VDRALTQLAFAGVAVEFGATRLLESVTFTVTRGERWGIIGRNGVGKTTLFRLATGELVPATGSVARVTGLRCSLMDQQREFGGAATVWEAAAGPFRALLDLERSLAQQAVALAEAGDGVTDQALARYDRSKFEGIAHEILNNRMEHRRVGKHLCNWIGAGTSHRYFFEPHFPSTTSTRSSPRCR
jgi:ATPase subunit of ABC transporter with duplicated ATPase domains